MPSFTYDTSFDNPVAASSAIFEDDFDYVKKIVTELVPFKAESLRRGYRLPNSKKEGYSSIYINESCHLRNNDKVYDVVHPSLSTLNDIFNYAVKIYGDKDCFGERKFRNGKFDNFYTYESYNTIANRRLNIGSGFLQFLKKNRFLTAEHDLSDFILSVYSSNRLEWALTDIACHAYAIPSTALYDTLGQDSAVFILKQTKSPIMVCTKNKLSKVLKLKPHLPLLVSVVSIDDLTQEDEHFKAEFLRAGMELIEFKSLEKLGELYPHEVRPPTRDSIFTISFTSGTTGSPKGVVLNHSHMAAVVTFNAIHTERPMPYQEVAHVYSFLPLAHIFERTNLNIYLLFGLTMAFPTKDDTALTLLDNFRLLKPIVVVGVPRLFNRLESGIKSKVENSWLLSKIIDARIARQEAAGHNKIGASVLERFVINKLRAAVGFDNLAYCITGSAPINPATVKFLKAALDIGFSQGFGATEMGGGCMTSDIQGVVPGTTGAIGSCMQVKLRSLPDINYFTDDSNGGELDEPMGEMLMRGPQIFKTYYKNEAETKAAFDDEGWYHTGDVAKINKAGSIYIVDRVKNFFKLSQGEFIVPEKIENVYLSNNSILSQLFIHGDPTKTHLVGIVGIDKPVLEQLLSKHAPSSSRTNSVDELVQLVNSKEVKKAILKQLNNEKIHRTLTGFEKLQNIHIDIEPLKIEHDVITPTSKIKRNKAKSFFASILQKLYEEGKLLESGIKL